MNIGEQIKARRTELNITQQDLADRLNVSRSAISNWETDKNYPDLQIIVQISEALQISLDELLNWYLDSFVIYRFIQECLTDRLH